MSLGVVPLVCEQSPAEEFITIPFDYNQLSPQERDSIIPICIKKMDRAGQAIAWRWFVMVLCQ
jgi:hypothetical protein